MLSTASRAAQAQLPAAKEYRHHPQLQHCLFSRSKRDRVPVYEEPDATSARLGDLLLGEEVCDTGEVHGYAILEWEWQDVIRENSRSAVPGSPQRAFVKATDLWPGQAHQR